VNIHPGTIINNRFEIIASIGEGGFAQVFKSMDLKLGRLVAVKVLKSLQFETDEELRRFQREAQILAKLLHRNIVSVYAFDLLDNSQPFLVMEYLEGTSLARIIATKGRLECDVARRIFLETCEGLSYAHQSGIIHRDLSPQNIFLIGDWPDVTVKLIDFGLSKIAADLSGRLTKTGLIVGNPQYMSPEQIRAEKVGERADIYSLGCVMYECLAGAPAFRADSAVGILYRQQHEYPRQPDFKLRGEEDAQLKYVVLRCLQKEPARRFQSCQQLIASLESCAESAHDSAAQAELPPELDSWTLGNADTSFEKSRVTQMKMLAVASITLVLLAASIAWICSSHTGSFMRAGHDGSERPSRQQLKEWLKESSLLEAGRDYKSAREKRLAVTGALALSDRNPFALAVLHLEIAEDYQKQGRQDEAGNWARKALTCLMKVPVPDHNAPGNETCIQFFQIIDRIAKLACRTKFSPSESRELLDWYEKFSNALAEHMDFCNLIIRVSDEYGRPETNELTKTRQTRDIALVLSGNLTRLKQTLAPTEKAIASQAGENSMVLARHLLGLGNIPHLSIPQKEWREFFQPLTTRAREILKERANADAYYWNNLAKMYLDLGDYRQAQLACREADRTGERSRDRFRTLRLIAEVHLHGRRFSEAEKTLKQSLKFWYPEEASTAFDYPATAYRQLALSLIMLDRKKQAADELLDGSVYLEKILKNSDKIVKPQNQSLTAWMRLLSAKLYLLGAQKSKAQACLQTLAKSGDLNNISGLSQNISCLEMDILARALQSPEDLNLKLDELIAPDSDAFLPFCHDVRGYASAVNFYGQLLFECEQVEESAAARLKGAEAIEKIMKDRSKNQDYNASLSAWLKGNAAICFLYLNEAEKAKDCLSAATDLSQSYHLDQSKRDWLTQIAACRPDQKKELKKLFLI
jgi:serine/threonine protein kinase/tetratricopeptide (TPR) repeat protein